MPSLIAAYGEWWDPHNVTWVWGNRELAGTVKSTGLPTNVWEQRGIYILFEDRQVVYVGKTGKNDLGKRLRDHLSDDIAGRWDRFSWYGIRMINKASGTLGASKSPHRTVKGEDAIGLLEALLMRVTVPPLNRRREALRDADLVVQQGVDAPRPVRSYLVGIENQVQALGGRMDRLEQLAREANAHDTL